jgi:PAS domain-containing protein
MARVPEMNGWKFCHIAAVTAIMLCSAWSIAWLAGWLVAPDTWPVRLGLLCGGLLAAGGVAAMLFRCSCRQQRALERLLRDGRLGDFATRTRDAFDDLRRRLQEAEHVHSALEVRYRRAAAEAERIRSIFFRLADPILVVDDYDELVLANPRAEALLGLELDKAEHRALAGVVRCQKLVDLLLSTSRRKGGGSRHDEIELPGPCCATSATRRPCRSGTPSSSPPSAMR